MVARDGDGVEVTDDLIDEVLLYVSHQSQRKLRAEDAGVLCLVFFKDVGLYSTTYRVKGLGL